MRALLLETEVNAGAHVERALHGAGHTVVRCHEPGAPAFPCAALADPGSCPLDGPGGIDVAVVFRAHPHPKPTTYEDGVSCALRREVPVVVAGTSILNPYEPWVTHVAEGTAGDVVEVCESAARAPLPRLTAAAAEAARAALAARPELAQASDAVVRRDGNALFATVTVPVVPDEVEGPVAVRVVGALRAAEPTARSIDVSVVNRFLDR